ncbi:MAG TPA: hypothetical protein VGN82_01965 [Bosea sp. (in: a-proteobacteria)]|jgi:hypothetical protein|uniref:hypothetical protein n=1 Tax=Bosea sp. (in: a-proteobacteria) TaxID=1871050 RepID=UPI002E1524C7|nr:hypothetical protein [Bosea sp. (in: a-proteobacteria)]
MGLERLACRDWPLASPLVDVNSLLTRTPALLRMTSHIKNTMPVSDVRMLVAARHRNPPRIAVQSANLKNIYDFILNSSTLDFKKSVTRFRNQPII